MKQKKLWKSIRVISLLLTIVLINIKLQGQINICPIDGATIKKKWEHPVQGLGDLNSITVYPSNSNVVKSIINGVFVYKNDTTGIVSIKNKRILVKYWSMNIDSNIKIGKKVKLNQRIGTVDIGLNFVRIDLFSDDKEYLFKFMDGICTNK